MVRVSIRTSVRVSIRVRVRVRVRVTRLRRELAAPLKDLAGSEEHLGLEQLVPWRGGRGEHSGAGPITLTLALT